MGILFIITYDNVFILSVCVCPQNYSFQYPIQLKRTNEKKMPSIQQHKRQQQQKT